MSNAIKQLASFAVLNVNGGNRISYTYDEINGETGEIISGNNKGSFFVVDSNLMVNIDNIREYIRNKKLN